MSYSGHATLGEERANDGGENRDDELNDGLPSFLSHSCNDLIV